MNPKQKKIREVKTAIFAAWLLSTLLVLAPALHYSHAHADEAAVVVTEVQPASAPVATPATTTVEVPAATPAPAPSGKVQKWWQSALEPVLYAFALFLSAFLVAGLRKLTKLVEKKWSVEIPDSVERMMTDKARWAVAWAEEKAEQRLLYGDGQKTPGAQKIHTVTNILQEFAESIGHGQEWQRDRVEALAEGVLHLERDVAVGSPEGARADALAAKKNGNG